MWSATRSWSARSASTRCARRSTPSASSAAPPADRRACRRDSCNGDWRRQPGRLPLCGSLPINELGAATLSRDDSRCSAHMAKTVYVLNGPNLNLLGTREPEIYGHATLADVEKLCRDDGASGTASSVEFRQSNHEGEIIDWIQEARAKRPPGIVINPAATRTPRSRSSTRCWRCRRPMIEVHISNIHAREAFRQHSYVSQAARSRDLRLRHRRLCARDRRPRRDDRRQRRARLIVARKSESR